MPTAKSQEPIASGWQPRKPRDPPVADWMAFLAERLTAEFLREFTEGGMGP